MIAKTPMQAFKLNFDDDGWTPEKARNREILRQSQYRPSRVVISRSVVEPKPKSVKCATELRVCSDGVMQHWLEMIETSCDGGGHPDTFVQPVRVGEVINILSTKSKIPVRDIRGESRLKDICLARQIGQFLAKRHTGQSFSSIGRKFNRDHSTVMHACEKVQKLIDNQDPHTVALVQLVESGINEMRKQTDLSNG